MVDSLRLIRCEQWERVCGAISHRIGLVVSGADEMIAQADMVVKGPARIKYREHGG